MVTVSPPIRSLLYNKPEPFLPKQDGKGFKRVLEHNLKLVHPFSVTVHKELVYWDDWEKKAIFMADKNSGKGVVKVMGDLAGAMDMKAFNRLHQVMLKTEHRR